MNLSIIIVNYKNYNLTKKCINSVINSIKENVEIIIVDNNSPNESYNELFNSFKEYEFIKIIKNEKNSGFGDANNIAVSSAKGKYILFLNPDIIVKENAILNMYEKYISDTSIGILSCKLLNEDLSLQYSCRRIIKFREFIIARTPLNKLFLKKYINKIQSKYLMLDYNHETEVAVDWVMGSCIMIKKDLFEEVGGFSKEYFMYFEDVDLCWKINKIGKKVLYYPQCSVIHLHKQESVIKINKLTFIHLSSMFKFYIKKAIYK